MSTPMVPPRPSRGSGGQTSTKNDMPQVPPRPIRKLDPSPSRNSSPLNELPTLGSLGKGRLDNGLSPNDAPVRPPIVALPSVGQEGSEYASYDQLPPEAKVASKDTSEAVSRIAAPEQTRNISANMPLHAPKASVPQSTAKSRIETVTSTDSTQAAAAGIGRSKPADDVHKGPSDSSAGLSRVTSRTEAYGRTASTEPHSPHPLRQKESFNRSTPSLPPGSSRPASIRDEVDEHGIPNIGKNIPLNPNAGDAQMPWSPTQLQHVPGIAVTGDGSTRAHSRRKSSRQEFGPPGSYGLHSHPQDAHDQFERDWLAKNKEKAAIENLNIYGTPRPETALSSEQLNRIVTQTDDIGMGTNPDAIGTPGDEIAWGATQEYISRGPSAAASPAPQNEGKSRTYSDSRPEAASPLRKSSFPVNERLHPNAAAEDSAIHVNPSERNVHRYTGGGAADGTMDFGPLAGNTEEKGGWFDEQGDGVPILASDEILKRPGSAFMQPAVNPVDHPSDDDYYHSDHHNDSSRRSSMHVPSRPSSRPNSQYGDYHGGSLYRFMSHEEHHGSGVHTPLEEIQEYEPLIPEGEEDAPRRKPKSAKRPGLAQHHFPSQDIWEDTPSSLQYSTTVQTPDIPREMKAYETPKGTTKTSSAFETPEQEQARKDEDPDDMQSDRKTFIKPSFKKGVQSEMHRPGVHRFPSQDIWEDSPDSVRIVTTVSGPQMDEVRSPPDDRPTTSTRLGEEDDDGARATTGFSSQLARPGVPARPLRKSKLGEEITPGAASEQQDDEPGRQVAGLEKQVSPDKAKAPAIPDRPKPTVPARPARPSRSEQANGAELTKSTSTDSQETVTSPPAPKAKPVVPARPGGEKIASLKAGFMSDLNNRLKLGPQVSPPKAQEPELAEETAKEPLADARKSRAKGPARRKPASSPSAAADQKPAAFSLSTPTTIWHIDESEKLQVPSVEVKPPSVDHAALNRVLSDNEAHNTHEPALAEPMSPEKAETIADERRESLANETEAAKAPVTLVSTDEEKPIQAEPDTPVAATAAEVENKELAPAAAGEEEPVEGATAAKEGVPVSETF